MTIFFYNLYANFSSDETEDGPWEMVLQKTLDDSRKQTDPLPLLGFPIPSSQARFVKFELVSYYGNGGGLQYFNINNNGPKVVQEKSEKYDARFPAEKVLTRSLNEKHGNIWLLPDKVTGKGFMLDFGTVKPFNMVELVNTHSGQFQDRSTKEFKIYLRYIETKFYINNFADCF